MSDAEEVQANLEQYERLHATTDVTVWAKEWVSTAAQIIARKGNDPLALLDEGWMIGWFANYAQAVNDHMVTQKVKEGVHVGTWHAFLHFFCLDHANASIHCGQVRYSPITFRLAEFIQATYPFAMHPEPEYASIRLLQDPRLNDVLKALGKYEEDTGR